MKKLKSKKELTEMAQAYFDSYPEVDVFYATPDGQFFTEKNKSAAKSHAIAIKAETVEIRKSEDKGTGKNILDVLSDVSGLSKEEIKKSAQEVIDKKKASEDAGKSPKGEDKPKQPEANEEKVGEADGIVKEPIEAKADGSENVLEADNQKAEKGDSNAVQTVDEKPEWTWTMEKMADWLNANDVNFDLKDDKKTLWGRVKAKLGEAE